jgi:hypothetical protein
MLKKLLSKPKSKKKKEAASSALPTLDRLHETLEMLEKKECFLQKKASAEVERAKDYTKAKNKSGRHFVEETYLFVKKHTAHVLQFCDNFAVPKVVFFFFGLCINT